MDNGVQQEHIEQQSSTGGVNQIGDLNNDETHQPIPTQPTDTTRQSNTPVVSLLSLDQHQEKDFNSMQGGRRRKINNNTPPGINNNNNNAHNFNGYTATAPPYPAPPFYSNMLPPPNGNNLYGYPNNFNAFYSNPPNSGYGKYHGGLNNKGAHNLNGQVEHRNTWTRKRKIEKRNIETGSLSSLRTDSNSSASIVDDTNNRNDDKNLATTGVDTPPPAPYSPMTNYLPNNTSKMNNSNMTRYFPSRTLRGGHNNHRNSFVPSSMSTSPRNINKNNNRSVPTINSNEQRNSEPVSVLVGQNSSNKPSVSQFSPQVHAGANQSQHFAPPMRRGRRSMRRSGQAINEIGAGDAPLPNSDVSDACKKLDSLKLWLDDKR